MIHVDTPLRSAVGGGTAAALARELGLQTVGELLAHYPRRYERHGELTSLADLAEGEHVTVHAEITRVSSRQMQKRPGRLVEVVVTDGAGELTLIFFNQPWRGRQLRPGQRGLFSGKVTVFTTRGVSARQLTHPAMILLDDDAGDVRPLATKPIPVYPATGRLPSWRIAQAVELALGVFDPPADPLPDELRRRHGLLPLAAALTGVHRPETFEEAAAARHRLTFDEAFTLQVELARRRAAAAHRPAVPRPRRAGGLLDAFDAALPFELTAGQARAADEVFADLAGEHPMQRLLQGEVGSGKTVVALRAMLTVVDNGGQAALLAPTEVLAAQHARAVRELLGPLGAAGELGGAAEATRVVLLTGSVTAAARRARLAEVADGSAGIVIGTHALLEEAVGFADLGLVVVDEQHRFGVEQRDALRAKSAAPPHVLVMTATPIPRTVAMTVYGDLEVSTLRELPGGRVPVQSTVVPVAERAGWLDRVWQRIREEVAAGHQAYVVCPRIGGDGAEDSDDNDGVNDGGEPGFAVTLTELAPQLAAGPLAGLRLASLHGRLAAEEKERVMVAFARGEVDVLVATTVVEVGVDVPNATVMVIMDADRYGVSQLHQLRGRVGRGSAGGLCLLVTKAPAGSAARGRIERVAATADGFVLARLDLESRREGDILGAAQSGRQGRLRLLQLLRHEDLIATAREEARALVAADPELRRHAALAEAVGRVLGEAGADYLQKA